MDPAEWEGLADRAAEEFRATVAELQRAYVPAPAGASFRRFWETVRDLNERVRTAPAIKLDDKMAIQHDINALCQSVRQEQQAAIEAQAELVAGLENGLSIAQATLDDASSLDDLKQARSDLALLRERIEGSGANLGRGARQRLWQSWQSLNGEAWQRLQARWQEHERNLAATLDEAAASLDGGNPRGAKERIKEFHAQMATTETSHAASRKLRSRANDLWRQASAMASERHATYLAQLDARMEQWRAQLARVERARAHAEAELAALERQVATAQTDVGAALLRGQLEERRRAVARMVAQEAVLQRQIDDALGVKNR